MDDLKKQAEELGLKIDENWTEEQLQAAIDAKLAEPKKAGKPVKVKTVPVRLLTDTWLQEDIRTPAGNVVDLPIDDAKKLIVAGNAVRADPLPGDE